MAHLPPSDPPAALPPSAPVLPFPPFAWEARAVFRESFLYLFTIPGVAEALRRLGTHFYDLTLEHSEDWPDWPESTTRAELRALALDLRHAQGFLMSVWKEIEVSSVAPADLPLCLKAQDWAGRVAQIALEVEAALGPAPKVGEVP